MRHGLSFLCHVPAGSWSGGCVAVSKPLNAPVLRHPLITTAFSVAAILLDCQLCCALRLSTLRCTPAACAITNSINNTRDRLMPEMLLWA